MLLKLAHYGIVPDLCSGAIQFCQDILLYGFSTFLPSIIKSMGYGTYETQVSTLGHL